MTNEQFNKLQTELKRNALLGDLAKEELNHKFIFSDESLKRAAKETHTRIITREELEYTKDLLSDCKFMELQKDIKRLCEDLCNFEGDFKSDIMDDIIYLCDIRDKHQEQIRIKYNF